MAGPLRRMTRPPGLACSALSDLLTPTSFDQKNSPLPELRVTLSNLRFHLTRASGNRKTGPIPVTTSSRATCAPTCPFLGSGCYADGGPLASHFGKVTTGERGVPFPQHCAELAALPPGQITRLHQAGDMPHNGGRISRRFVHGMVKACRKLKAYTYSHHLLSLGENLALLRYANRQGLTVNVSTESEAAADEAIAAGLPAVMAVRSDEERDRWQTPAGHAVLVCPAQTGNTDCATCQLCYKRNKRMIIAFRAHGNTKRKADAAIAGQN